MALTRQQIAQQLREQQLQQLQAAQTAQQQLQQPSQIQPPTPGILSREQEGIGDLFRNPTQAQLTGGITALLTGLSGGNILQTAQAGAGAFQNVRQTDFENRLAADTARREALQAQIDNALKLEGSARGIEQAGLGRERFEFEQERFGATEGRAFGKRNQFDVVIPQDGGLVTKTVQKDDFGRFFDLAGNPIQLPEGTRLRTTGKTQADLEASGLSSKLTKTQVGKQQERLIRLDEKLDILTAVGNRDLKKFLSAKGRTIKGVGTFLDFASGVGGESIAGLIEDFTDVNPIEFAAESRTLFEDLENFFNVHRKDITGAQAAFQELQQIRKAVLNAELPPAQAIASLNQLMTRVKQDVARRRSALREGIDIRPAGDLDSLQSGESLDQNIGGVDVKIRRK